jgi:hypothetical protein
MHKQQQHTSALYSLEFKTLAGLRMQQRLTSASIQLGSCRDVQAHTAAAHLSTNSSNTLQRCTDWGLARLRMQQQLTSASIQLGSCRDVQAAM